MKFNEWQECLCCWVNMCKGHSEPPKSLDEANIEEFFEQYIKIIQTSDSLTSTDNVSLLTFLTENYQEFKYTLNEQGCITNSDYIYVYSILLHYACVRKPCPQLKLQKCVFQHYISHFLRYSQIGNALTRCALQALILNIPSRFEDAKPEDFDDGWSIEQVEEWQREQLLKRFCLIKKRLKMGIRNANLLSASLNRTTLLVTCNSYKVSNLLPQICTFRSIHDNNDPHIEQWDYTLSQLIYLMQKHKMQMPILNQTDSLYTQLLSSIDFSLSAQSSYETRPEEVEEEEPTRMLSAGESDRDQEIIELKTQLNAQRKSAIDLLKIFKGTYDGTIDLDDSSLDSELCFTKLHFHFKSFCMNYKRLSNERNHLTTRVKFLYRQMAFSLPSCNQMIYILTQFDHLLNDLQSSNDMLVDKLFMARQQLNRFSQASYGFSEWVEELKEEFSIQVRIAAVKQLQQLMSTSDLGHETWSLQLMIKKLQLQCTRAINDRKFTVKRLKRKLNSRRRRSGVSVIQMRLLRQFQLLQLVVEGNDTDTDPTRSLEVENLNEPELATSQEEVNKLEADLEHHAEAPQDDDGQQSKTVAAVRPLPGIMNSRIPVLCKRSDYYKSLPRDQQKPPISPASTCSSSTKTPGNLQKTKAQKVHEVAQTRSLQRKQQLGKAKVECAELKPSPKSRLPIKPGSTCSSPPKSPGNNLPTKPTCSSLRGSPGSPGNLQKAKQQKVHEDAQASLLQREEQLAKVEAECAELKNFFKKRSAKEYKKKASRNKKLMKQLKKLRAKGTLRKHNKIDTTDEQSYNDQQKELQAEIDKNTWKSDNDELKEVNKNLQIELDENKKTIQTFKDQIKTLQVEADKNIWKSNNNKLREINRNLQSELDEKKKIIQIFEGQNKTLQADPPKNIWKDDNEKLIELNRKLQSELDENKKTLQIFEDQNKILQAEIDKNIGNLENDNMELKNSLEEREKEIDSLMNENITLHQDYEQFETLKNKYNLLKNSNHELGGNMDELNQQVCKLEIEKKDLLVLLEKTKSCTTEYLQLDELNARMQKNLDQLNRELNEVKQREKLVRSDYVQLKVVNTELQEKFDVQNKELEELQDDISKLRQNLNKLKSTNSKLTTRLRQQKHCVEILQNKRRRLYAELSKARSCNSIRLQFIQAKRELNNALQKIEELEKEKTDLDEYKKQLDNCKSDYTKLIEINSQLKEASEEKVKLLEIMETEKRKLKDSLELKEKSFENVEFENVELREEVRMRKEKNSVLRNQLEKQQHEQHEILRNQLEKQQHEQHEILRNQLEKQQHEHLKQVADWNSQCLKLKEIQNELKITWVARQKLSEQLQNEIKVEEIKQADDKNCEINKLQNELNAKVKLVEQLMIEKNDLKKDVNSNSELKTLLEAESERLEEEKDRMNVEIERSAQLMCDFLEVNHASCEVLTSWDAEKQNLYDEIKKSQNWNCGYLKLLNVNCELNIALNAKNERIEILKKTTDRMSDAYHTLENSKSKLQSALDGKLKQIEKLKDEKKILDDELNETRDCMTDYRTLESTKIELQNALYASAEKVTKLEGENESLRSKQRHYKAKLQDAQTKPKNVRIDQANRYKILEKEYNDLKADLKNAIALDEEHRQREKNLVELLAAREANVQRLEDKLRVLESVEHHQMTLANYIELKKRLVILQDEKSELIAKLNQAQEQLGLCEEKIRKLERENAAINYRMRKIDGIKSTILGETEEMTSEEQNEKKALEMQIDSMKLEVSRLNALVARQQRSDCDTQSPSPSSSPFYMSSITANTTEGSRNIDVSQSILGKTEEKTSEQKYDKKALEMQVTSLKLEIGRLNALVARQQRSDTIRDYRTTSSFINALYRAQFMGKIERERTESKDNLAKYFSGTPL